MKIGVRTPSIKKSVSARTTGRINREIKRAVNPVYGKKVLGGLMILNVLLIIKFIIKPQYQLRN